MRRIIKTPSNASVSDTLLIDYINRFVICDIDARMQLFDYKTKYTFITQPGVDKYNMPLYTSQSSPSGGASNIAMYPVYQGFFDPAYVDGVQAGFYTRKENFQGLYYNQVTRNNNVAVGDGTIGPYTFTVPNGTPVTAPLNPPFQGMLRGHVDITGIMATNVNNDPILVNTLDTDIPVTSVDSRVYITTFDANNNNMIVQDSGQFLSSDSNYGLLMEPGKAPYGNQPLSGGYSTTSNTINYLTGQCTVTFPNPVPAGVNINVQSIWISSGKPTAILFNNNTLTLRVPPASQYQVELQAYLTPAAYLSTGQAQPFGYMCEYISLGAARKYLTDTRNEAQFNFYEPIFREQELLVWKRSDRINSSTRRQTIYSSGNPLYGSNYFYGDNQQ